MEWQCSWNTLLYLFHWQRPTSLPAPSLGSNPVFECHQGSSGLFRTLDRIRKQKGKPKRFAQYLFFRSFFWTFILSPGRWRALDQLGHQVCQRDSRASPLEQRINPGGDGRAASARAALVEDVGRLGWRFGHILLTQQKETVRRQRFHFTRILNHNQLK